MFISLPSSVKVIQSVKLPYIVCTRILLRTELERQSSGQRFLRLAEHLDVDCHGGARIGRQHGEEVARRLAGFGVEGREGRGDGGEVFGEHCGRLLGFLVMCGLCYCLVV